MRRMLLLALLVLAPVASAKGLAFEVEAPVRTATVEPQRVASFPANLTNVGDVPVRVAFEVKDLAGRATPVLPRPVTLQPSERGSVMLLVHSPFENGRVDETATITYLLLPSPPGEPAQRALAQELTVTLRTVGTYVPGAAVLATLAALGVGALASRRSR